jgi:hypothetical protein
VIELSVLSVVRGIAKDIPPAAVVTRRFAGRGRWIRGFVCKAAETARDRDISAARNHYAYGWRTGGTLRPAIWNGWRRRSCTRIARALCMIGTILTAALAYAEPITVRYPEGPTRGFVELSDLSGTTIAHGDLVQWLEQRVVVSQFVIRFNDGSVYDELIRFSQNPVFRLLSYKLVQKGPSFAESSEIEFDRTGRYRVRSKKASDAKEEQEAGTTDIPADVTNGMTSLMLKNLKPGTSAKTHLMAFTPNPRALELALTPEGEDKFWIGDAEGIATRFRIEPRVTGVTGTIATVIGKQPPAFHMWIAQGKAPALVRFQGPLYIDGPVWRVELSAPRWKP